MAPLTQHRVLIYGGIAATAAVALAGTFAAVSMSRGPGSSGLAGAQLDSNVPGLRNDYMKPVGEAEASRRAATNNEQVATAAADGTTAIAQPVIAESYPAGSDKDEMLKAAQPDAEAKAAAPAASPTPAPTPQAYHDHRHPGQGALPVGVPRSVSRPDPGPDQARRP